MSHKKNLTEEERLAAQREYYANNKDRKHTTKKIWRDNNPDKVRDAYLKNRYGITLKQYEHMFTKCDGKCMLCGTAEESLYVDHCHGSDNIRGLLCSPCNLALGLLKDNIDTLVTAIKYLSNPPCISAENLLRKPRIYTNKKKSKL